MEVKFDKISGKIQILTQTQISKFQVVWYILEHSKI